MAKAQTENFEHPLIYDSSIASTTLLGSNYSQGLTQASTTWQQWITTDPSNVGYKITPTYEKSITGHPETAKQFLLKSIEGTVNITQMDIGFKGAEVANGQSLATQFTVDASAWAGTVAGTTSTTTNIVTESGNTTGLAVGDALLFTISSGNNAYTDIRKVASIVDASNFTVDFALKAVPDAAAQVVRQSGYATYFGGNTGIFRSLLLQSDFGQAQDQHNVHVFKCQSTGGIDQNLGGSAKKTPLTFEMVGVAKTVGALTGQICPAANFVVFRNG